MKHAKKHNAKKVVSLLLVMMLVLAVAASGISAAAVKSDTDTVNVVIKQADTTNVADYKLYRMCDVTYNQGSYIYKVATGWDNFFATGAPGAKYVKAVGADKVVEWVSDPGATITAANLAKDAVAWAAAQSPALTPINNATADAANGTVNFADVPVGYYVMDTPTTTDEVYMLDTVVADDGTFVINDKNKVPTVKKEIVGDGSVAAIGDKVQFKITVTIDKDTYEKTNNLIIHDKMSQGFALDASSVKLTYTMNNGAAQNGAQKEVGDFDGETMGDFMVRNPVTHAAGDDDDCTFEVELAGMTIKQMKAGDVVTLTYDAEVSGDAAAAAGSQLTNTAWITLGDIETTPGAEQETDTKIFKVDFLKLNGEMKLLEGAEFGFKKVTTATGGAETLADVYFIPNEDKTIWRVATSTEVTNASTTGAVKVVPVTGGKIQLVGMSGTYEVEETKVPEGFNKAANARMTVSDNMLMGSGLDTTTNVYNKDASDAKAYYVQNLSGSELPSTGGMGTTLFYIIGAVLVIAAVVLLVTRKKAEATKQQ